MISEMNVVPYIDVMLVLLIIFMAAAPVITYAVKVELPKVEGAKVVNSEQDRTPLIITVKKNGDLFMVDDNNEVKLELKDIVIRVKAHNKINPKRKAFIRGDSDVSYGKVVNVMGVLQNNGITEVGLVTSNN